MMDPKRMGYLVYDGHFERELREVTLFFFACALLMQHRFWTVEICHFYYFHSFGLTDVL